MLQNAPRVALSLPADDFADVARRVLGGAAGMLDLGFEAVDDVQLAVELVLHSGLVVGDSATITITGDSTGLTVRVGNIDATAVTRSLDTGSESPMTVEDVLERMVDRVELSGGPLAELVLHKARPRVRA